MTTLYWHDYETSGVDPQRDRPTQFAGVRTDEELNIIGDPVSVYCRLEHDTLPQPDACIVTGITPQQTREQGLPEVEFIRLVMSELAQPGTCGVGYNSLRFDDEVTRNALYRSFYDPYAREWQNGNSRWDIIDLVRTARALRPDGIEWPVYEDGRTCFKLEELTKANNLEHESAHDALSDVYATIGIARLIREKQSRLYDYAYSHRDKRSLAAMLKVGAWQPVLHVSAMYPADFFNTAMVVPVAMHPVNKNGIIVFDLRHDPSPLLDLDAGEIRKRLFTPNAELPEGVERIPLKTVHLNKCPGIYPLNTLDEAAGKRCQIDMGLGLKHLQSLKGSRDLAAKIQSVFKKQEFVRHADPDLGIYSGFFDNQDKRRIQQVRECDAEALARLDPAFDDPRLPELLLRYRGRNFPDTLNAEEQQRWQEYRYDRLTNPEASGSIVLKDYYQRIDELQAEYRDDSEKTVILDALLEWGRELESI